MIKYIFGVSNTPNPRLINWPEMTNLKLHPKYLFSNVSCGYYNTSQFYEYQPGKF